MRDEDGGSSSHGVTLGIEEEFFVVDLRTRAAGAARAADSQPVLDRLDEHADYAPELLRPLVESRTAVCARLDEVRAELHRLRVGIVRAATDAGQRIVAAGTVPLAGSPSQPITPKPRYEQIERLHQQVAREQLVCGCHVHVGISDRELAVQVLNRVRPWLPVLLALSASSPFWMGADSGYASYRTLQWERWPTASMPHPHRSAAEYDAVVQALIETDTILDAGQVYWDVRLGNEFDTLEFRTADSCTTVDEAVLQAGLCRALVRASLDEVASGQPLPEVRPELLRAAKWRAARSGLDDHLIDALAAEAVPAPVLLDRFLAYLRPALEDTGDWDETTALLKQIQRHGTSAHRQRRAFARAHRLADVIDLLVTETASSC